MNRQESFASRSAGSTSSRPRSCRTRRSSGSSPRPPRTSTSTTTAAISSTASRWSRCATSRRSSGRARARSSTTSPAARFIDCLGGYGIYSAGIRHPKIVKAVADQLQRMPLSSQELHRPAARRAGRAARRDRAGRPAVLVLHQQRHRRGRGRLQAGAALHRPDELHLLDPRLPRQELRLALADGQVGVPRAVPAAAARRPVRRVRRRRGGRGRALQGRRHRQGGRGGDHGADPGRGRRDRPAGRLLAAHPQGVRRVRRAADRRRGPDRHGAHRQDVRRRALEHGARHPLPRARPWAAASCRSRPSSRRPRSGACSRRTRSSTPRRSAATRSPAPPASRRSTSPSRRTCVGQAHKKGRYLLGRAGGAADALRPRAAQGPGQGPSPRPRVREHRDRLQGGRQPLQARRPGRRHAHQLARRAHRAGAQHLRRADRRGARHPRRDAQRGRPRDRRRSITTRTTSDADRGARRRRRHGRRWCSRDLLEFAPAAEVTAVDRREPIAEVADARVRATVDVARRGGDGAAARRARRGAQLRHLLLEPAGDARRARGAGAVQRPRRPLPRHAAAVRAPRRVRRGRGAGAPRHGLDAGDHQRHGGLARARARRGARGHVRVGCLDRGRRAGRCRFPTRSTRCSTSSRSSRWSSRTARRSRCRR